MFIVSLNYVVPLEAVDQFVPEHMEYLDEQYKLGYFQLSGRKEPRTGGIIIATVENRETLEKILQKDPFHREKIAQYEVTEFVLGMSSQQLAFLLD